MSASHRSYVLKHQVDFGSLYEEDIYCLGYVMLYAMTGFYPTKKHTLVDVKNVISHCFSFYSKKLVKLVEQMIEESSSKRILLKALREKLKHD